MLQKFLRREATEAATGKPTSSLYRLMAEGLFPRPIKLSARAVAWPESEVIAWQKAMLAGASEAEVRALVATLVAARQPERQAA